jgi:hypothetical protein
VVGARFDVVNQVPGHRRGRTPVVTAYEPHRRYAVSPTELSPERWSGCPRSSRNGEGTLLTESHEVTRPVGRIGWLVIGRLFARTTGAPSSARGIANLDAVKATAEAQHQDRVG